MSNLVGFPSEQTQTSPMHNAAFSGEEGKMRRKTDMCRAFERGDCGWTSRCNYAHSRVELRAARYAYERWKETGTVTPSTSAPSTTAPTPATATKSQVNCFRIVLLVFNQTIANTVGYICLA